jgi:hypothetical protein
MGVGINKEVEKQHKVWEHLRRQVCKVLPKHWECAFPERAGAKLVWKISVISFDCDTQLSYEHLQAIAGVLNTYDINIVHEGGTQGYSEWTPGSDANVHIEARTEVK